MRSQLFQDFIKSNLKNFVFSEHKPIFYFVCVYETKGCETKAFTVYK